MTALAMPFASVTEDAFTLATPEGSSEPFPFRSSVAGGGNGFASIIPLKFTSSLAQVALGLNVQTWTAGGAAGCTKVPFLKRPGRKANRTVAPATAFPAESVTTATQVFLLSGGADSTRLSVPRRTSSDCPLTVNDVVPVTVAIATPLMSVTSALIVTAVVLCPLLMLPAV